MKQYRHLAQKYVRELCEEGDVCELSEEGDVCELSEEGDVCELCEEGDVCELCEEGDVCMFSLVCYIVSCHRAIVNLSQTGVMLTAFVQFLTISILPRPSVMLVQCMYKVDQSNLPRE